MTDKNNQSLEEKTKETQPKVEKKAKTEDEAKKNFKVSAKLTKLIAEIEKLSVLELADLVKALEDKFGIAAAPIAAPAAAATPAEEKGEESAGQSTFKVILTATGDNKIGVIKAVREINSALGLKEAKDLVEAAPKEILTEVKKEEAEAAQKKLQEAGAKAELK